ncbi:MAG TPA: 2-oxo acid dehydrogenase subunit E2 [Candidatus Caldiarchaeum subterraneum]|uniref:2-oxo acid dehydrogenase subunit E2 n=1 Tax=Caldiarchaeum subterraneum TaxID=311458 RepID=A0A832ZX64_CALS0|nr:2-oxo acid dehydrogenase subunit E2 [Candidatus Caldarchaeum subterraneum]
MVVVEVKLPDIGEGIAEGEVAKWLVKEGDHVSKYQPLVEVITVKVNVEIPSPYEGRVVKLLASEGQVLKVGEPLLVIETAEAGEKPVEETAQPLQTEAPVPTAAKPKAQVLATPAVRKLARELGVDLATIQGTGPGGRITEEDVRRAAKPRVEAAPAATVAEAKPVQRIPIKGLRRIIADHLTTAKNRAALVTIFDYADASALISLRESLKPRAEELGVKITYLPIIMKLLVPVLRQYPMVNANVDDEKGEVILFQECNIGVAVDAPEGLTVPVVKNVESKDVFTLARELEQLSEKARQGKLSLDDVRGGTFSITNYGAIGGLRGTPIINYPEVAILGTGRIEKRPVVVGDEITVRPIMELALTADHRIVDGGYMSGFLNTLKKYIENPGYAAMV